MRYSGFHRAVQLLHGEVRQRWPISMAVEVDLSEVAKLRAQYAASGLAKPSYTACITWAASEAISHLSGRYPELNCMIRRFLFRRWLSPFPHISAGVAVSREEDGLDRIFVRVIREPHLMSLLELTKLLNDASTLPADRIPDYQACQAMYRKPGWIQRLMLWIGSQSPELHCRYRGSFSLTTVGKFGIDLMMVMPLTTPIQFGFGSVRDRVIAVDGKPQVVPTTMLTMAFDRRLMNGKPVAESITRIADTLCCCNNTKWLSEIQQRPNKGYEAA